jgi:protein involved in polysaccharide export with SLBB domain
MPRLLSPLFGKNFFRALSALIALALLLGDVDLRAADPAPAAAPAEGTGGDTVLHNNDLIRITVFGEDDLLTETRISKGGTITFPLLGALHLSGKTVDEATAEIRQKLDKDYVINPHVTLMVLEYATQWVTVLGEVQKPGTVEIPPEGGLDVLGAIALAGGYTKIAAPNRITIRRQVNGQDQLIRVDGKKLANDTSVKVFYVLPGDMITVGQSIF